MLLLLLQLSRPLLLGSLWSTWLPLALWLRLPSITASSEVPLVLCRTSAAPDSWRSSDLAACKAESREHV